MAWAELVVTLLLAVWLHHQGSFPMNIDEPDGLLATEVQSLGHL